MNKSLTITLVALVVLVGGFFVLNSYIYNEKQAEVFADYKDAEYMIEGEKVTLEGDFAYFGNEFVTDLNDDGRDDVVFLITHAPGGSGRFYYAVSALNMPAGDDGEDTTYIGSDGYLLGDRIAPQTIELSPNPRHKNVVVVNYTDRASGEPMTISPSIGKSVYLKLDLENMQWGIVEPDFEGEER